MSTTPHAPPTRFLLALGAIAFIGPLAIHLFMPVMPEVQKAFGIAPALTGAAFSVTLFLMASTTLVYGSLSDHYGRRPVLLAGLSLFLLGTAICALAASVPVLLAGRAIQALGAGAAATLNRAIAHDAYGPGRLVEVLAYLTMAYTLGPMLSPLIGGILIDWFGWRSTFWFALAAGAAITAAVWLVVHETRPPGARSRGAAASLGVYFTLLRQARFCAFILQSGCSTATFMALATAASFLMQDHLGRPAREYGLYFMSFPFGLLLGNLLASRLSGRAAIEAMVLAGSVIMALAVTIQAALVLSGPLAVWMIFVPGFFLTLAQGIAMPNAQTGAMRAAPNHAGTAAGLGVFSQMLLGALGAQAYALLADGTPTPMVYAMLGFAALALAAGIVPIALKGR